MAHTCLYRRLQIFFEGHLHREQEEEGIYLQHPDIRHAENPKNFINLALVSTCERLRSTERLSDTVVKATDNDDVDGNVFAQVGYHGEGIATRWFKNHHSKDQPQNWSR